MECALTMIDFVIGNEIVLIHQMKFVIQLKAPFTTIVRK